jgi:hypothetical protein
LGSWEAQLRFWFSGASFYGGMGVEDGCGVDSSGFGMGGGAVIYRGDLSGRPLLSGADI